MLVPISIIAGLFAGAGEVVSADVLEEELEEEEVDEETARLLVPRSKSLVWQSTRRATKRSNIV